MSVAVEMRREMHTEPSLRCRTIAIVGYAETCQPPESVWADAHVEKWTLNHGHTIDPRWDRLFEFHSRDVIDEESRLHHRGVDQWGVMRGEQSRPIYMREAHDDVRQSVRFPVEEFVEFFGARCEKIMRRPYVEMAAGYMIGYAIMKLMPATADDYLESPEIQVYGFELFDGEEYDHQRACFEFYAGWAMGAGIKVIVPETSAIFANRGLYEYGTGESARLLNQANRYLTERFELIKKQLGQASQRNADAVAEMQTLSGVLQEVEQQRTYVRHLLKGGNFK